MSNDVEIYNLEEDEQEDRCKITFEMNEKDYEELERALADQGISMKDSFDRYIRECLKKHLH